MTSTNPRLGVSSWSLNKALTRGDFTLLELPGQTAAHGLGKLEICHFHFPSTDPGYLADLKAAFADAGVIFFTYLQDTGDITHPDPARREEELAAVQRAIDIASAAGAQRIRVIAGMAKSSPEALDISGAGFLRLAEYGADRGVQVVTENWHGLLDSPADVDALMERTQGKVGLKFDFGNWPRSRKYDDLPKIAKYAVCTHAKADFPAIGEIDRVDFDRCLDICKAADFPGPHILIFSSPGDEWTSLDLMRDIAAACV